MPDTSNYESLDNASKLLPKTEPPLSPAPLYQEKGARYSRALGYRLYTRLETLQNENKIRLYFNNEGKAGAVYHVYDLKHLDQIPRRYTVEAGKSLFDEWSLASDRGAYDLEVHGTNGYFHGFSGNIHINEPEISLNYDAKKGGLTVKILNPHDSMANLSVISNSYDYAVPESISIKPKSTEKLNWLLTKSGNWYDFSIKSDKGFHYRFAGRVETGKHSITDPAMAKKI